MPSPNTEDEIRRQAMLVLERVRMEIFAARASLREFSEVLLPQFREQGFAGQLVEGYSAQIQKLERVKETLMSLWGDGRWEPTETPDQARLDPDTNNTDPNDAMRGKLWFDSASGEHYLEGELGPDEGKWFRRVGQIQFRCPNEPQTGFVNTGISMSPAQWTRVGPEGNSVNCHACSETHGLTRGNSRLVTG